ncbi:MAG TPA: hypothetical protein VLT32_06055 [Candidatus Sulfomarinibacteraceae bacterium]|nr:hypothetical protein [Candidatus Sulfomarinibacteraceae bacterium]
MSWVYSCPHCGSVLNPDETIILIGVREDVRVMVGLRPEPGDYRVSVPPGFAIEPGSVWGFQCPLCRDSLISELSDELCCLDMIARGVRHRVYFSRTAGEHATFVLSAEGLEQYGEHADRHSLEILEHV